MTGNQIHHPGTGGSSTAAEPPAFDRALALADAVLYEGYVLYPYRKSSGKNRVRWQFGVLAPRGWIEAQGPVVDGVAGSAESWWQQTECLLEAPETATVHVRVRFLQSQAKTVLARDADGTECAVETLDLGDRTEVSFDEARPQQTDVTVTLGDLLAGERRFPLSAPGGRDVEPLHDRAGRPVGVVVRTTRPLLAALLVSAERVSAPFPLVRLRIRVENAEQGVAPEVDRDEALRHALLSTHCLVAVDAGAFLSLADPPVWATPAAKGCRNIRTFPVLAGPEGSTDVVLSAPIILYDHAQVAPESPGDLHDATEIDEILSLRTLTLTEEEKREARGTDPRVAAIVDRVDAMPPEVMERLHGAVRSLRPTPRPTPGPPASARPGADGVPDGRAAGPDGGPEWWQPGGDAAVSPATDSVLVDGVRVTRGSRVRLAPRRRGSDAHDMFLAGRTARVEAVLLDVDGSRHVAVTIEDDPTAEMHEWYGRFHHFRPEEITPLDPPAADAPETGGPER